MRALKRLMPKTLYWRSLLIIVTPLILVQLIATWIFFDRHWETVQRRMLLTVANDIVSGIDLMRYEPKPPARDDLLDTFGFALDLRFDMHDDAVLPNVPRSPDVDVDFVDPAFERVIENRLRRPFRIVPDEADERRAIVRVQLYNGVLDVSVPRNRIYTSTPYVFMLWMVGSSLILLSVALLFMRGQIRPIRRLAAAAEAFGKGRDVGEFKIGGAAEVRQAALAFRVMRQRIMRQVSQRTEMLAGVSHDLRTPLTRMKLALAMLGNSPEVEELESDVDEMQRMLDGYLAFARGDEVEPDEPASLTELIRTAASGIERAGGRVVLDLPDEIVMPMKRQALQRCLVNVLGNAMRYAGSAWVNARIEGDTAVIDVDDDGPGVPEEERENVFRPFYRLDGSRNRATGGNGLGLAIARDAARAHGGEIELGSSPHGGLRVRLKLPL